MTTANLGFAIDSSQAVSAASDLKAMTDASRRAQDAASGLQRGAKSADTSLAALSSQASTARCHGKTLFVAPFRSFKT
jgi:uncharacterized phage infection (PIP) family protein YhgE